MTIQSTATRLVDCSSSSVLTDTGLSGMVSILDDVFNNEEEEDVIDAARSAFQSEYGAGNVVESVTTTIYEWYWDPETKTWKPRVRQGSTFVCDDGETHDLQARIYIYTDVE